MGAYHLMDMHLAMTIYRVKAFRIAQENDIVKNLDWVREDKPRFHKYFGSITIFFAALVGGGLILVTIFLEKSLDITSPIFPYYIRSIAAYIIFALVWYFCIREKAKEDVPESLEKSPDRRDRQSS
jgi:hypothetical protein